MPTYDFRCENGHTFERMRPMSGRDKPAVCNMCGGVAKRIFVSVPVLKWSQASAEGGRPPLQEKRRTVG